MMTMGQLAKVLEDCARTFRNGKLMAEIVPAHSGQEITTEMVRRVLEPYVSLVNQHIPEELYARVRGDLEDYVPRALALMHQNTHIHYAGKSRILTQDSADALLVGLVNVAADPMDLGLRVEHVKNLAFVRNAMAEDIPRLIELLRATSLLCETCDTEDAFQKKLAFDPNSILVLEREGVVIGMVFTVYDPWASFIYHLAIDPEHQAFGLGHHLAGEAEARLRARGTTSVNCYVSVDNRNSLHFLNKRGYTLYDMQVIPVEKVFSRS